MPPPLLSHGLTKAIFTPAARAAVNCCASHCGNAASSDTSVPAFELPAPVSGMAKGLLCCWANWIRLVRLWLWPPLLSFDHTVAAGLLQ